MRESDVARVRVGEELVDKLVQVKNANVGIGFESQSAIVSKERFEEAIDVGGRGREAEIERAEGTNVFELVLLNVCNCNLLLGRDLQHFQREAHKRRRASSATERSADFAQTRRFVKQRCCRQSETMLFPICCKNSVMNWQRSAIGRRCVVQLSYIFIRKIFSINNSGFLPCAVRLLARGMTGIWNVEVIVPRRPKLLILIHPL